MPTTPQALYTNAGARQLDARAEADHGLSGFELMQRAARAALALSRRRFPHARRLCVVCGPGNNGGDGFVLAALARSQGLDVDVLALTTASDGDAGRARRMCVEAGVEPRVATDSTRLPPADLYVDALFGSGLNRAPEGVAAGLIEALNASGGPLLALDVPSGVDGDTGACNDVAVRATVTLCLVAWKRGLFTHQAVDCCGERHLDTLDLPSALFASHPADAQLLAAAGLPPRAPSAHKGDNGHVLVMGGDHGFGGAPRMVGEAALRVGAGLVSIATRVVHAAAMLAARPELMVHDADDLASLLPRAGVLAVGAGLGQHDWGRGLWRMALDADLPMVLDADGLNLLAREPREFGGRAVVLTPHPGEAARLLGCGISEVQGDRFASARRLARRYQAVVVLKGAGSLVAAPDERVAVCPWGNPGMAGGGMGDVLGGVLAGLMAQGLDAWDAACLGTGLHARAGDLAAAAGQRGLLATDLFPCLRRLVNTHER